MKKQAYRIIWEDEHLVALDKSDGVLSIPDRYLAEKKNIQDLLKDRYGNIFTLHRLDKDTSGLMLFAKTENAHRKLSSIFENREIQKTYLAIIKGIPDPLNGQIVKNLGFNKSKKKVVVQKEGKESITHYECIEMFQGYSALQLELKTGRMHQIRAHLESISKPLIVDPVYGGEAAFYLSSIKRKYNRSGDEERPLLSRTPLHASQIKFKHPESQEVIHLEAALPKDMRACLKQFRKWIPLNQNKPIY